MLPLRRLSFTALLAIAVAACSSPLTRPARSGPAAHYSGFLQDYSLLKSDPADPAYRRYVAPAARADQYRKFLLEQPVLIVNTGDQYQSLDPERVLSASAYYRERMTAALSKHYQVVAAPGPGVVRLRVAIVGLVEVRAPLEPSDFIPLKALFNLGRQVAGLNPYVLRMSVETEALDSQTGQVLGEAVDSRESRASVAGEAQPADAQLHALIDFWVARFVARLDKANGYAG